MRSLTDLGRPRPSFLDKLRDLTDRVSAGADLARVVVEGKRAMSVLDKLGLVADRRAELDKKMSDGADALLARYEVASQKTTAAFNKHHARLDAEAAALDATEAAIDRLSNSAGNSTGSGASSEPPQRTGTEG